MLLLLFVLILIYTKYNYTYLILLQFSAVLDCCVIVQSHGLVCSAVHRNG